MLGFSVGDHQALEMKLFEGSEGLIGLEDQKRRLSGMPIGAQIDQLPAEHKRRVHVQGTSGGNQHRGGRRLPVSARGPDRIDLRRDRLEEFGSSPCGQAGTPGSL